METPTAEFGARRRSKPVTPKTQGGFAISLEFVLIVTILGIGLFVGIVAVRDALFKFYFTRQSSYFYVVDSNDLVLGKTEIFDEHEAPLLTFVDYDPLGDGNNYRALIGVRDDRFTSRQRVFYSGLGCTGTPCITGPSAEAADNTGIDNIAATGAVSYLLAMQTGGPSYGVGAGLGGAVQGRLFRQGSAVCASAVGSLQSQWTSQEVVTASPCTDLGAPINPAGSEFYLAEQVVDANGDNVLDVPVPPFFTNLAIDPSLTNFVTTPPTGE